MPFTPDTQNTRPLEELRTTPYPEMNSAEITKLMREDPEAYKATVTALDTPAAPAEASPEPLPMSKARAIYKNGELVDTATAVRYVNGVLQQ